MQLRDRQDCFESIQGAANDQSLAGHLSGILSFPLKVSLHLIPGCSSESSSWAAFPPAPQDEFPIFYKPRSNSINSFSEVKEY